MAIFNENYIKEYDKRKINNNKQNLNESLLSIGIFIILSPFILLIASIMILSKIADNAQAERMKKVEENFNKLIKKYPQLKQAINNIFIKTQDFLIKKIKLKYNILEKYPFEFDKWSFDYNKNGKDTKFIEPILYTNPEKYIKSTALSKYLNTDSSGKYTSNFVIDNMNNDKDLSANKEKYDELYKLYEDICDNIYEDLTEIDKYIEACNNDLSKNPNGNMVKLEVEAEEPYSDSDFPMFFIYIEIDINNIEMTDEIKAKVEELKAKSGKYLRR